MGFLKALKLKFFNRMNVNKNTNINIHQTASFKKNEFITDGGEHRVKIGEGSSIRRCHIVIEGSNNKLIVGEHCNLSRLTIEILGCDCVIEIGNRVKNTGPGKWSCQERDTRITIGHNCLIATGVTMLNSDGHDILINGKRVNHAADILLDEQVWLGQETMLLKGAHIGKGSVIGARSMVTKHIPPNSIAAGSPCRVIREGVEWDEHLTY